MGDRPDAVTAIPNLFLASDYVRTYTDLATMEGANEAARRAVNGILDAHAARRARRCDVWRLHEPAAFAPRRALDRMRWRLFPPARRGRRCGSPRTAGSSRPAGRGRGAARLGALLRRRGG